MRLTQSMVEDINPFPRRKRGRPAGDQKKHVSIYVLPETVETLRARAFRLSIPLGAVVDRLLAKFKKQNQNEKHISTNQNPTACNTSGNKLDADAHKKTVQKSSR